MAEVEDLETGEPVTKPGERGRLVITALDRLAQPCIRFDSKDIVEISDQKCDCGRTYKIFLGGVIGRADDITKVKGVLLAPSAIEDVVRSIEGLGDNYEVLVEKKGDSDSITLKVELVPGFPDSRVNELEMRLSTELRLKTNLGYNLEFYPDNSLPRFEVKAKRFRDLRNKEM